MTSPITIPEFRAQSDPYQMFLKWERRSKQSNKLLTATLFLCLFLVAIGLFEEALWSIHGIAGALFWSGITYRRQAKYLDEYTDEILEWSKTLTS